MKEKERLYGKLEVSDNKTTNPNFSPLIHIKMIIKHACLFFINGLHLTVTVNMKSFFFFLTKSEYEKLLSM